MELELDDLTGRRIEGVVDIKRGDVFPFWLVIFPLKPGACLSYL